MGDSGVQAFCKTILSHSHWPKAQQRCEDRPYCVRCLLNQSVATSGPDVTLHWPWFCVALAALKEAPSLHTLTVNLDLHIVTLYPKTNSSGQH